MALREKSLGYHISCGAPVVFDQPGVVIIFFFRSIIASVSKRCIASARAAGEGSHTMPRR